MEKRPFGIEKKQVIIKRKTQIIEFVNKWQVFNSTLFFPENPVFNIVTRIKLLNFLLDNKRLCWNKNEF